MSQGLKNFRVADRSDTGFLNTVLLVIKVKRLDVGAYEGITANSSAFSSELLYM